MPSSDTQFKKGNQLGKINGGGRKPMPPELRAALEKATPDAVKTLHSVLSNPGAKDADRIRAAEVILDRAYGKPAQAVELEAEIGQDTRDAMRGMGLKERIEAVQAALEAYESTKEK